MAKAVRLSDIAAVVGVSTVTVSKALSDQRGVSDELRDKIKQLAEEMGYQHPSSVRRNLPEKQYTIGVIVQEIYLDKYTSFYWHLYQELMKRAISRGCFTVLELVARDDVKSGNLPMMVRENRVDGIIVIGLMDKPYLVELEKNAGVPIVYMDYYDNERTIDTVIFNSFYGSYMLTNYLYDMGHRDIAFVGTPCATNRITDRYLGYVKSMMEHGIEIRKEWIFEDRDINIGRIDLDTMMHFPEQMPTAFVCNCDLTAGLLIKKLNREGYEVPKDFSVVGFDNYIYPGTCDVEITTYEVDTAEVARRAFHKIIRKITNEKYTSGVFIVDGHMVYKDSVARR